jgi:hypothetical protein
MTAPSPSTLERRRTPPQRHTERQPSRRATKAGLSAFLNAYVEYEGRLREIGRLLNDERRHPSAHEQVEQRIQELKLHQLETATRLRTLVASFIGWR